MNILIKPLLTGFLLLQSALCFSSDSVNLILLPDPFRCHQLGAELAISENSTLGLLGRSGCESDRPTYGEPNDAVNNTFSRLLMPWRYAKNGVFKDGYFLQPMIGLEQHKFKSDSGSTAKVSFTNIALHAGHQWFWDNGFNISVMAGGALLVKNSSKKTIHPSETTDIIKFLDKNTKTNLHGGAGVFLGWKF